MDFRSNKFVVIKSFIISVFGLSMIGILIYIFTKSEMYGAIAIGLALLVSILMTVSEWRFRVELDGQTLRVYSGQKLKRELDITQASFFSRTKQGGNNIGVDCSLQVTTSDEVYTIDCTPLGGRQYHRLLEALGFDDEPQILETRKMGDHE